MKALDNNLYVYNALDSACTFEIRDAIWDDLAAEGFRPAYDMTLRLFEPIMFMMTRGIKIDRAALEDTKRDITAAREAALVDLHRIVGFELNPASPKQVQHYFYVEKEIEPYRGSDGIITADDRALSRIARGTARRKGLREARVIQDIRGYDKLLNSYMEIQFDADDRLRSAINPRGTKFGRLSTGETIFGTGCNQQAMPQEFKKFLVPDDDYFFLEFDKRQAEWVVVAYVSGDARMLHVIETKRDPHTYTGAMMLMEQLPLDIRRSIKQEDVEALVKIDHKLLGLLSDEAEIATRRRSDPSLRSAMQFMPRTMSVRQAGKKANHGLNYDETFRMFALMNEILEAEATKIINLYHKVYPGVRGSFHEWIKQQLTKNDRMLVNCFGRRIRFLDQWGPDLFKSAYSAIPQSTVVDGTNIGMCKTYNDESITVKANADLLAQTHDSILMQFPTRLAYTPEMWKMAEKICDYLSPTMEYGGRSFKIPTDLKAGWNWGGYHSKSNPIGMQELPECRTQKEFTSALTKALGNA